MKRRDKIENRIIRQSARAQASAALLRDGVHADDSPGEMFSHALLLADAANRSIRLTRILADVDGVDIDEDLDVEDPVDDEPIDDEPGEDDELPFVEDDDDLDDEPGDDDDQVDDVLGGWGAGAEVGGTMPGIVVKSDAVYLGSKRFDVDTSKKHPLAYALEIAEGGTPENPNLILLDAGIRVPAPLRICLGNRGRYGVERKTPLCAIVRGTGANASTTAAIVGLQTGEKYEDGHVNRDDPAVKFLELQDLELDFRHVTTGYPIVTGVDTRMGHFGVRRCRIRTSGGVKSVVKTPIRGNAAASSYVIEDVVNDDGANEYAVCYLSYGPGLEGGPNRCVVRRVSGRNGGRGVCQLVMRHRENEFVSRMPMRGMHYYDLLVVDDVKSVDNGGKDGSSAVSIAGWGAGGIMVRRLDVDTLWNAAALTIALDVKQLEVSGKPSHWKPIGPGMNVNGSVDDPPRSTMHVYLDLRGSRMRNGHLVASSAGNPNAELVDVRGVPTWVQRGRSTRHHVSVDSAHRVQVFSDAGTVVDGMGVGLEIEKDFVGSIQDDAGNVLASRSVGELDLVGNFSGWNAIRRQRKPIPASDFQPLATP